MKLDRDLPPPQQPKLHGGERVKLTVRQEYEDGVVVGVGSEGLAMHPGSQAATWIVYFPKLKSKRVVPGWDIEVVDSSKH